MTKSKSYQRFGTACVLTSLAIALGVVYKLGGLILMCSGIAIILFAIGLAAFSLSDDCEKEEREKGQR